MGVHGLTGYLRSNRRPLSETIAVSSENPNSNPIHLVVDGWSFIYELHNKSTLPWVYGGEYRDFGRLVTSVVQAWLHLGFKLSFVFDGPIPAIKFSTLISRTTKSNIEPSLLFFRTSPVSRSTPRFLNESRIIPPLSYSTTISALKALENDSVTLHFADEEGDPYAVELAGKLGAYVVGNDSDFVVLNTDGYMGFVPLDEMVWSAVVPEDESVAGEESGESQWQEYRAPKARKKTNKDPRFGRGIIPPEETPGLTLSFTVYNPNVLAAHLKIPVSLLPLLGALLGNDFSNQSAVKTVQQLFFERQMTPSVRINKVAATLQSILSPTVQKRRSKHQVEGVVDLIDKTVRTLLIYSIDRMGQGEIEEIVDRIVEATLQYAIPRVEEESWNDIWPTEVCALHKPEDCPMLSLMSQDLKDREQLDGDEEIEETAKHDHIRSLLLKAYRIGNLSPLIVNCLNTATFWPRHFLESPDQETVSRMTRVIRQWCYAVLDDSIGLPRFPDEADSNADAEETRSEESDQDELIDVVESNSEDEGSSSENDTDLLAPLRGALQRLHDPARTVDGQTPGQPSSSVSVSTLEIPSVPRQKPAVITEYLRRGTRVADEPVTVPSLKELLPDTGSEQENSIPICFLLRPADERLDAMLYAFGSDSPIIRSLPPSQISIALALRWVLKETNQYIIDKGPSKHNQKWTRREIRCLLASFHWKIPSASAIEMAYPPIVDRHVQLTAQILQSLESVQLLAEVMLLSERVSSPALPFSGKTFHSLLTGSTTLEEFDVPEALLEACIGGMESCLGEDIVKKSRKKAKDRNDARPAPSSIKSKTASGIQKRGLFDLLNDAEV
ncbi:hypothetical protein D9758_008419 [Tetrapyrgos nigripes]|uniref:Asteroid domain-containing protein n=1 Tax=Tetrapyrgos nigripes TaxID=182062 RepID=A0A8H5FQE2_9AGAR|nr:hypothetical protein D9758_008419 [Tetrapyrgos nigripes]